LFARAPVLGLCFVVSVTRETGHTHNTTTRTTPHTNNHTNEAPNPPTAHSTTLKGGATTVRTTTHARVGGRAEVGVFL